MLLVTATGTLMDNYELLTDKKGHNYVRFKISCRDMDSAPNPNVTLIRCFSYNTTFANLKKDDFIFLTGTLKISSYNGSVNFDIYVGQLTKGIIEKK